MYTFFPVETVITDNEPKNKVEDDYSIQSADSKMSKSEIKIARQSHRKRYYIIIYIKGL